MPETIQERQASLNEELLSAASEGDIDRMRRAIARGASLKAGMEEGRSLARAGGPGGNGKRKKEALEWLLGLGALKMITAEKAGLALRSAIKGKIAGAADLLAKAGAAVEARDEKGRTGVWEAANLGDADWVRKWLRLEADPRAKSADGDEPLHAACKAWMGNAQFPIDEKGLKRLEGHRRCAKLLVKAGADLDAKGAGGNSPAHVAALFGCAPLLRDLERWGAKLDEPNGAGETPLAAARAAGRPEAVECLLELGADPWSAAGGSAAAPSAGSGGAEACDPPSSNGSERKDAR